MPQPPLPLLSTQSTSLDAISWSLDHLEATLEFSSDPVDYAKRVNEAWSAFEEVRGRIHDEHTRPLFGIRLDALEASAARRRLEHRVSTTQNKLMLAAFAQLVELCRTDRLDAAAAVVRHARWELFAPLMEHVLPAVRQVVGGNLGAGGHTVLEEVLVVEKEPQVIGAIVQRLHQLASPTSAPALEALLNQLPAEGEFRRAVSRALLRVKPQAARALVQSPSVSDRLVVFVALQDAFETPDLAALVQTGLEDESEEVVLEALRLASQFRLVALAPALGALASSPTYEVCLAAIETLGALGPQSPACAQLLLEQLDGGDDDVLVEEALEALLDNHPERAVVSLLAELTLLPSSKASPTPKLTDDLARRVRKLHEQFRPDVGTSGEDEPPRELLLNPTDEKRFLVYADQLSTRGDVRGELIMRSHRDLPLAELVRAHPLETFGPLAELLGEALPDTLESGYWAGDYARARFRWQLGFVRSASVWLVDGCDATMAQLVAATLRAPMCALLRELRVGETSPDDESFSDVVDVLLRAPQARRLTHLAFGDRENTGNDLDGTAWGDVGALWRALPGLTSFTAAGACGSLGELDAPALRSLTIEAPEIDPNTYEALLHMRAPALEELRLVSNWGEEVDAEVLAALFARSDVPLRQLAIRGMGGVLRQLLDTPVLRGLEVLDMSHSGLTVGDVELLLERPAAFAHLWRIDLSRNLLAEIADDLADAVPNAILGAQLEP